MRPLRSFRSDTPTTGTLLHAAYERRAAEAAPCSDDDWRRDHMGASVLGHKCDRYLWLSFRWAGSKNLSGRMLRLLERGRSEESWLAEDLRAIGIKVWDRDPNTNEQFRVRWNHVGGGCDLVLLGLIEAPEIPHVGELKTSNAKQFARLKEKGVEAAKPEHFTQMQVYMHGLKLEWALYLCVCKDTDEIYTERVAYSEAFAIAAVARGEHIALLANPPKRQETPDYPPCMLTSKDGTQWPCQFHNQCWKGGIPARSCRTCISSTPLPDGTWRCDHHRGMAIDRMEQRRACEYHVSMPSIVGHQVVSVEGRRITYQTAEGEVLVDGVTG